jgi:hypothetical protein
MIKCVPISSFKLTKLSSYNNDFMHAANYYSHTQLLTILITYFLHSKHIVHIHTHFTERLCIFIYKPLNMVQTGELFAR